MRFRQLLALGLLLAAALSLPRVESLSSAGMSPRSAGVALLLQQAGPRGSVLIRSVQLVVLPTQPVQAELRLSGDLPTPCHELGWIITHQADAVLVEVFSRSDPRQPCIQVLHPFDATIPLGSFESSRSVWVNGELVGTVSVQRLTVTSAGSYLPGLNSVVVEGGGPAAEVARVVARASGMTVRAVWVLQGGIWRFYLPDFPDVDGGLRSFPPSPVAAFVVLEP